MPRLRSLFPTLFTWLALTVGVGAAAAADVKAGPKGGRLLETEPHAAEFLVTAERHVEITFYDAAQQPVSPGDQVVTVIAEAPRGRETVAMDPTATGFVSETPLPAGEPYRVVVQMRASPDSRPRNFRIDLNLAACAECGYREYACTCEGH